MLKELYQQLVADAKAAVHPKLIELPQGNVLLHVPGGESKIIQKDPVLFNDSVSSVDSMLDWCGRLDEGDLFISVHQTYVLVQSKRDQAHTTDRLRFDLKLTAAMIDLLAWANRPRTQQQVVTALRTALADTFDDKYLPIFRRLDFSRKNDGSKSIAHTGESLGKSVEARAQSASGEIPEKLVFDVNVFSNINSPGVSLWFALDIDANIEAISINPIGDCIGDAYRTATRAIVSDLKRELPKALVVACCD